MLWTHTYIQRKGKIHESHKHTVNESPNTVSLQPLLLTSSSFPCRTVNEIQAQDRTDPIPTSADLLGNDKFQLPPLSHGSNASQTSRVDRLNSPAAAAKERGTMMMRVPAKTWIALVVCHTDVFAVCLFQLSTNHIIQWQRSLMRAE